ncbi:hypothetical protein CRD59_04965 [Bifidobacterium xylocopae]|uniref:Acyltransferase 3 domain-containing protein n=1 Tax=Bifidobacterium xylocopae TaxID=2493119 RepID=A0A366KDP2_9BIFI|nr:hypothetical protein CRD59_04965 [Bifidobacterium xylocopae]
MEALRLAAIAGISVFHVFSPWFWAATHPAAVDPSDALPALVVSALPNRPGWALWLLGLIALLGSWGNHVFYMISAWYLVPGMASQADSPGYWRSQLLAGVRRCLPVLATIALYALLLVAANARFHTLPAAGRLQWVGPGLEFVWLYMLFVLLAPAWAWLLRRCSGSGWARACGVLLLVAVQVLNGYIAFVNQGDTAARGLLDWRKQMSALTYLVSFAVAGALGWAVRQRSQPSGRSAWTGSLFWGRALGCLLVLTLILTGYWAMRGSAAALYALSFKSTSLLAFALALAALCWCALQPDRSGSTAEPAGKGRSAIAALASGILGFYIVQSLAHDWWAPACEKLLAEALHGGTTPAFIAFFAAGLAFSLVFTLIVLLLDLLVRQPALRLLGLGKRRRTCLG